jgi:hypothetical protein
MYHFNATDLKERHATTREDFGSPKKDRMNVPGDEGELFACNIWYVCESIDG